uniref:Ig-like domain-containing protein n=1 Tax=Pseudonaja textilis TaxID=8673 RepID=A0A670ZPK1_PSETE
MKPPKRLSCVFWRQSCPACFVSGQTTVTQKHQFLSVKEEDSILLDCSYQGMEYNLQWYKQYPGGQPEFMVFRISPGTEVKDHFEMMLETNNKTTSLYLKNTQLKDSAVYFCAGWSTVVQRHLLAVVKGTGEAMELHSWWPSE